MRLATSTTLVATIARQTIPNIRDHCVHAIMPAGASMKSKNIMKVRDCTCFQTTATLYIRRITGRDMNTLDTRALIGLNPHGGVALERVRVSNRNPNLISTTSKIVPHGIGRTILHHVNLSRLATRPDPRVWRHPQWCRPGATTSQHVNVKIELLNCMQIEFAIWHLRRQALRLPVALHHNGCWITATHLCRVFNWWTCARRRWSGARRPHPF